MQFPTVVLIDKLLDYCRGFLSVTLINLADRIGVLVGGWAIYGIAALLFIVGLVAGIRGDSAGTIIFAVLLLPIGVVLQYVAVKMLDAVDRLVESTPTSMHGEGFLSVIAVAAGLIGAIGVPVSVIFGIIAAARGNFGVLMLVMVAVYFVYLAALALNPTRIAVSHTDDNTIGQEAIGLATFVLKSFYKFVPVLFGVTAVVVAIMTILALVQIIGLPKGAGRFAPNVFNATAMMFILLCLIPLLGYILFLGYYLFIDVLRALLTLGASRTAELRGKAASGAASAKAGGAASTKAGGAASAKAGGAASTKAGGAASAKAGGARSAKAPTTKRASGGTSRTTRKKS